MASNTVLQHPPPFDFKAPDGWPKWKRRYLQFQEATGLEEDRQVSTFLYCIGEEANDVLTSTNISEEDAKKFDLVVAAYFGVRSRHNVIFERARFNQRDQLPEESVETYISELYRLAENCKCGAMKDELIRDQLVVGIRDRKYPN